MSAMFVDVCRTIPRVVRTGAMVAKTGAMFAVSFIPSSTASLQYKPLGAVIETMAREYVSVEVKHRLDEEKRSRLPTYAVPINSEVDIRTELGQMMDDKWEDKKRVILKEVDKKIKVQADKQAREAQAQRAMDDLPDILRRIAELECQVKAQADRPAPEPNPKPGSFGRRRFKIEEAEREAGPSKDQFDKLSDKMDAAMLDQGAMKNDIEVIKQGLSDVQGRLSLLENSAPAIQASPTNADAVAAPTSGAGKGQSDPCSPGHEEMRALKAMVEGFSKRLESLETVQGNVDVGKMWEFCVWATAKFEEYDRLLSTTANEGTGLNGVAAPTAGAEQPRAGGCGCDHEEVSALTSKTEDHGQRLDSLESTQTHSKSMWDFCVFGTEKFKDGDRSFNEINKKIKEIESAYKKQVKLIHATMTEQKESFEQKLGQQKESSDKDINAVKESMKEQMKSSEAIADKAKEAAQAAAKDKQIEELKADKENLASEKAALAKQIEAQDETIAAQGKTINAQDKQIADLNAGQKVQDEAIAGLQKTVAGIYAYLSHQNGGQQSPVPGQHQPQPQPFHSQPAPAPQGNGPWTPAASPPDQGHGADVDMGGADGDADMMDAPPQPRQNQQPQPQPPRQPIHQQPQPSTAAPRDTPMGNAGSIIPNNGNAAHTGNMGGAQQPPRMAWSQSFLESGPTSTRPSPNPSSAFGPRASHQNLSNGPQNPISSGSGPSKPTPAQAPAAGNAKAPAPANFGFSGPAPPVSAPPQMNWGAQMGEMSFETPPEFANQPPAPKPRVPLPNAAPKTASTGNNGPSSSAQANGASGSKAPSSSAAGSPSTPAKPTPKPAQKKPPVLFNKQGKPMLTPNKFPSVTSKAQTAQTPAARLAAEKQAAFAAQFSSASPPAASADPMMSDEDYDGDWEDVIPGFMNKPNPSPFATQPKTPASMPKAPTSNLYGSPYLKKSPTHDTVEANTPMNVFAKAAVEVPEVNADAQMSDPETKPESSPSKHVHEPERNPRKHINPEDAPVVPQQEDTMDTDRKVVKPKGRGQKMTTEQIKAHKDRFNEEESWAAFDRAQNQPKPKDPGASEEDELDYADPNDMNDEDLHTTVAGPPKRSIKPTKYSFGYYITWKAHFLGHDVLQLIDFDSGEEMKEFYEALDEFDKEIPLDKLLAEAALPTLNGYNKYQMETLMNTYRENVFFDAVRAISEVPPTEDDIDELRRNLDKARDSWFQGHHADVV